MNLNTPDGGGDSARKCGDFTCATERDARYAKTCQQEISKLFTDFVGSGAVEIDLQEHNRRKGVFAWYLSDNPVAIEVRHALMVTCSTLRLKPSHLSADVTPPSEFGSFISMESHGTSCKKTTQHPGTNLSLAFTFRWFQAIDALVVQIELESLDYAMLSPRESPTPKWFCMQFHINDPAGRRDLVSALKWVSDVEFRYPAINSLFGRLFTCPSDDTLKVLRETALENNGRRHSVLKRQWNLAADNIVKGFEPLAWRFEQDMLPLEKQLDEFISDPKAFGNMRDCYVQQRNVCQTVKTMTVMKGSCGQMTITVFRDWESSWHRDFRSENLDVVVHSGTWPERHPTMESFFISVPGRREPQLIWKVLGLSGKQKVLPMTAPGFVKTIVDAVFNMCGWLSTAVEPRGLRCSVDYRFPLSEMFIDTEHPDCPPDLRSRSPTRFLHVIAFDVMAVPGNKLRVQLVNIGNDALVRMKHATNEDTAGPSRGFCGWYDAWPNSSRAIYFQYELQRLMEAAMPEDYSTLKKLTNMSKKIKETTSSSEVTRKLEEPVPFSAQTRGAAFGKSCFPELSTPTAADPAPEETRDSVEDGLPSDTMETEEVTDDGEAPIEKPPTRHMDAPLSYCGGKPTDGAQHEITPEIAQPAKAKRNQPDMLTAHLFPAIDDCKALPVPEAVKVIEIADFKDLFHGEPCLKSQQSTSSGREAVYITTCASFDAVHNSRNGESINFDGSQRATRSDCVNMDEVKQICVLLKTGFDGESMYSESRRKRWSSIRKAMHRIYPTRSTFHPNTWCNEVREVYRQRIEFAKDWLLQE